MRDLSDYTDEDIKSGKHLEDVPGALSDVPASGPGSSAGQPFIRPPAEGIGAIPYAAWCLCCLCNCTARSTFAFDFYSADAGRALVCERCNSRTKDRS